MTENEAIKILKKDSCYECSQGTYSPFNCEYGECRVAKAARLAIKALEEVQKYRAIGTPEECRAAAVKQTERSQIGVRSGNCRRRKNAELENTEKECSEQDLMPTWMKF